MTRRLAILLALASACVSNRAPHVPGDPAPAVKDSAIEQRYQATLERFTGHGAVYDYLDTKSFFQATWQSPQFIETRVERTAMFKSMPPDERTSMLNAENARVEDATEFFFAAHLNDSKFDDFDRPNSIWRLALLAHGQEFKAVSIDRIGRTDVTIRSIYSYMESFWVGYRVRFPKVLLAPGQKMTLRAASPLGKADLDFTAQ